MKQLTTLLLLLLSLSLSAQKMGKFSDDIVKERVHPQDSTAHAAYIKKNLTAKYDFEHPTGQIMLVLQHHYIIKIYDSEGESYANRTIHYYKRASAAERVTGIKAVTHNLVDGKVKQTKLSIKDVFSEQLDDHRHVKKFAMPDVRDGSVIEIKYTIESPFLYTIPRWYFQNHIPTDVSVFTLDVPAYLELTPVPAGSFPVQLSQKAISSSLHGEQSFTFTAKNVPAIEEDLYVLNINDYRSSIKYEISSTHFPNQIMQTLSKTWSDIGNNLMNEEHFGLQLERKYPSLDPLIEKASAMAETERIQFLYDHVRSNYNWDEYYSLGENGSLKRLIKNKSGTATDINLLLCYLLRRCKVECDPVLIKTRERGLLNTNFPTLTELNYILIMTRGENQLLMDASSKNTPLGELPFRALNIQGIRVIGGNAKLINITNPNVRLEQANYNYEVSLDDNSLKGTGQTVLGNYAATLYRNEDPSDRSAKNDEEQADDSSEFETENDYNLVKSENLDDIYQPIKLDHEITLYDCVKKVGDKIFIDAALDFGIEKNPFAAPQRDFPIFFSSKIRSTELAVIKIPDGYKVESLPEPVNLKLEQGGAALQYQAIEENGTIKISMRYSNKKVIYQSEFYPPLKELFQQAVGICKQKIVLVKA